MSQNIVIAQALRTLIEQEARLAGIAPKQEEQDRLFFRVEGFDQDIYKPLLDSFTQLPSIEGHPLEIRCLEPVGTSYEQYALEPDRTATYYRNRLEAGNILILLFPDVLPSDAQSLADLHTITESQLVEDGLVGLIHAALKTTFPDYSELDVDTIRSFLTSWRKILPTSSLRVTTAFLMRIGERLTELENHEPGEDLISCLPIDLAIGDSLPALDLFRSKEVARRISKKHGELTQADLKILREIGEAGQLGVQPLETEEINKYLREIDTKIPDLSVANRLKTFIEHGYKSGNREALQYYWEDVSEVFGKRKKTTTLDRTKELGNKLRAFLNLPPDVELDTLADLGIPDYTLAILGDLEAGEHLNYEQVAELLSNNPSLPKKLRQPILKKAGEIPPRSGPEFLTVLTRLGVELLTRAETSGELVTTSSEVKIKVTAQKLSEPNKAEALKAAHAFRALYGGIEQFWPFIEWDLQTIWQKANEDAPSSPDEPDDPDLEIDDENDPDSLFIALSGVERLQGKVKPGPASTFTFTIEIPSLKHKTKILWTHEEENAIASLANVICYSELGADIYNAPSKERFFSLSSPGRWYSNRYTKSLAESLEASFKSYNLLDSHKSGLLEAVKEVDTAYKTFGQIAKLKGVFAAVVEFETVRTKYEQLLQTCQKYLKSQNAKRYGMPVINRAWTIAGSNRGLDWAVVLPTHPLKLMTHYSQVRFFGECLKTLSGTTDEEQHLAAPNVFRRELEALSSTASFPSILALSLNMTAATKYFVPVEEKAGFELYLPEDKIASEAGLGLATDTTEDERAIEILARVAHDYLETYPFTEKGLQLAVTNSATGKLPIALIEAIRRKEEHPERDLMIKLLVHTADKGPVVYQNLTRWLETSDIGRERLSGSYIPKLAVNVVEQDPKNLGEALASCNSGLVVMANTFSGNASLEEDEAKLRDTKSQAPKDFLPTFQVRLKISSSDDLLREVELNQPDEPAVVKYFYICQFLAKQINKEIAADHYAAFSRKIDLREWEKTLLDLHERFNWVICYDTNVDRRILQNVCGIIDGVPQISVIRYTTGLGPKRQHSLTVSSSRSAREAVRQRLLAKVSKLIPSLDDAKRQALAEWLVREAHNISGNLVLRATGRGVLVNELIGIVLAKYSMNKRFVSNIAENEFPPAVLWLSADEYSHWFEQIGSIGRSRPDLIGLEMKVIEGQLHLRVMVVEAKYLGDGTSPGSQLIMDKSLDQVKAGIMTLLPAWTAGNKYLDNHYWYDQLYRAIVAQIELDPIQQEELGGKLAQLYYGDFNSTIEGHTCIFTYQFAPDELNNKEMLDTNENDLDQERFEEIGETPVWSHKYSPDWLKLTIKEVLQEEIGTDEEFEIDLSGFEDEEEQPYLEKRRDLLEIISDFDQIAKQEADLEFSEEMVSAFGYEEAPTLGIAEILKNDKQAAENQGYYEAEVKELEVNAIETPQTTIGSDIKPAVPSLAKVLEVPSYNIENGNGAEIAENQAVVTVSPASSNLNERNQRADIIVKVTGAASKEVISSAPTSTIKVEEVTFLPPGETSAEPPKIVSLWTPFGVLPHSDFLGGLKNYHATGENDRQGHAQTQEAQAEIERIFKFRGVRARIVGAVVGPRVIRLKVAPQLSNQDYNSKILAMGDLFKQRIGLPAEPQIITGTDKTIWIDLPRKSAVTIGLKDLLAQPDLNELRAETRFPIGVTLEGLSEIGDLRKTAHWLVGGTTGSGKSIFLRSVLLSLLYNNSPQTLKLVLVDPKADMSAFRLLPHTSNYVMGIDSPETSAEILIQLNAQIQERIKAMQPYNTNELDTFHKAIGKVIYPRVVVIIEEYATLLDGAESIRKQIMQEVRKIAAVGRSSGIHLFVCTQHPLAEYIGSMLKANLSGRVALKVASRDNSQVILDTGGAEKLLKNGDMLYFTEGGEMKRLQAPFVSEEELLVTINQLKEYYSR